MLLTRLTLIALLVIAALVGLGTVTPVALVLAGMLFVALVIACVADWRISAKPAQFDVTRLHDQRLSLGAENAVTISIRYSGTRRTQLIARDEYPPTFYASTPVLDATSRKVDASPVALERASALAINPAETATLSYTLRPPRRGDYAFGALNLRWDGALGLVRRQHAFKIAAPVKVFPNLLDIRKYDLLARRGLLQQAGLRRTRVLGRGTEFERLREYTDGDEFRTIDWKATARRSTPIVRQHDIERSQTVIVAVDVGRLMTAPAGDLEKVDYAINAALMLGYVSGVRGDKVGLLAFADTPQTFLAPKAGRGQFYRMLELLYAQRSEQVEPDLGALVAFLGARQKKRALIVIFSDIVSGAAADAAVPQLGLLTKKHVPVLVTVNDAPVIAMAKQPINESAATYERAIAEQTLAQRALRLDTLRQRGVQTLDVPANELSVAVVNRYLELKSKQML
jgi:uncharacterized protein (DUF58 family)